VDGEDIVARTRLPAEFASVREARRFVHQVLGPVFAAEDMEVTTLLTSEVVTNAVVHAGSPVDLVIREVGGCVQVEASDSTTQRPVVAARPGANGSGLGLAIVAALSQEWGVVPTTEGKTVWFRCHPGQPDPGSGLRRV
jgi:anti-sigma regulatory factor (Ser/Thr protein kinase)